jgi:hypothetical protein
MPAERASATKSGFTNSVPCTFDSAQEHAVRLDPVKELITEDGIGGYLRRFEVVDIYITKLVRL